MLCDDYQYYVVKLQGNPRGPYVLANEFLGNKLLSTVGIQTPPCAFVLVEDCLMRTAPARWFEHFEGGKRPCGGIHFGSAFIGDATDMNTTDFPARRSRVHVWNRRDFLRTFVVDVLANNQSPRQVVFSRAKGRETWTASFIDNAAMFGGTCRIFDDALFRGTYFDKSRYRGMWDEDRIERYVHEIADCAGSALDEYVEQVPREWCKGDAGDLVQCLRKRLWKLNLLLNPFRDRLFP